MRTGSSGLSGTHLYSPEQWWRKIWKKYLLLPYHRCEYSCMCWYKFGRLSEIHLYSPEGWRSKIWNPSFSVFSFFAFFLLFASFCFFAVLLNTYTILTRGMTKQNLYHFVASSLLWLVKVEGFILFCESCIKMEFK